MKIIQKIKQCVPPSLTVKIQWKLPKRICPPPCQVAPPRQVGRKVITDTGVSHLTDYMRVRNLLSLKEGPLH